MAPDDYVLVQLFDFNTKQGQIADVYAAADVEALIHANLWDMTDYKPDLTGKPVNADRDMPSDESDFEEEDESSEDEPEEVDNDVI
jgi:hypothetical protein